MPPHQGALSMLNTHSTLYFSWLLILSLFVMVFKSLEAALEVFSTIFFRRPRRATNRLKRRRNDWAVRSNTNSMWTAVTTQQVNKHIHTFSVFFDCVVGLMWSGPAKSIPVNVKRGASWTQKGGNGGGGASRRRHTLHSWMISLTNLPLGIQCLDLNSVDMSLVLLWSTQRWALWITRELWSDSGLSTVLGIRLNMVLVPHGVILHISTLPKGLGTAGWIVSSK